MSEPPRRRGWFRRMARWSLWAFLILAVLHRPLLHFGIRHAAIHAAKSRHMELDLRVSGSIWTGIRLSDVTVRGDSAAGAPVERLKLDHAEATYSLWNAIRGDFHRVLRRVEAGSLDAVIALRKSTPEKPEEKDALADTFRDLLENSLSPVEHFAVKRVDLEVKGAVTVRGLGARAGGGKPGFIAWESIHITGLPDFAAARAELLLADSHLALGRLALVPSFELERLSVNRVTDTLPRGGMEIAARLGGGTAVVRVEPAPSGPELLASIKVEKVSITEVAALFGTTLPALFVLDRFTAKFSGAPEKIEGSSASVSFAIHGDGGGMPPVSATGDAVLKDGTLTITDLSATAPGVESHISGALLVPLKDFAADRVSGQIDWRLAAPDLAALKLTGLPDLAGAANGSGWLRLGDGAAQVEGGVELSQFAAAELRVESAKARITGSRRIDSFTDILATLAAAASFDARGISAGAVKVDSLVAEAKALGERIGIDSLKITSGGNAITAVAKARLKPGAAGLDGPPEVELTVNAPRIEQFGIAVNGAALAGSIAAEARLSLDGSQLTGKLAASGSELRLGEVPAGAFQAGVTFAGGEAILDALKITPGGAGEITASGRVRLDGAMAYSGELAAKFADLSKLRALAAAAGHSADLGGRLNLDWSGSGEIQTAKHSGTARLDAAALRHDAVRVDEVRIAADYTPDSAATRELHVVADKVKLGGQVAWRENRLSLSALSVALSGDEILTGDASFPLASGGPRGPVPDDQPLSARLRVKQADIAKLAGSFGVAVPASGSVTADVSLDGTLAKPDGVVTVALKNVKSAKAAALAPAEADIRLKFGDAKAALSAVVQQRDIQPLTLEASVPLDLEKLRADPASALKLPLAASVKLPATSLAIVPRFVPAIAKLDGTVAADIAIRGTPAEPRVDGDISVNAKSLRMSSPGVPPVSNIAARIAFTGDAATIRELRGETGGGSFNAGGSVKFADPANPVFDLRLRSDKVLVLRDESTTVRADADVALAGPLKAARVSGAVFVTQGRFTKDVDILPLSLPGKPKPKVRSVAAPRKVSFPDPPLRDWTFDLAIKTREKDPFLVRGNIARGAASLDLRLGGTGLNPYLTGSVRIDEFRAELPASRLEITRGFVTFAQDAPFEPRIDIQGQTRVGKTTVTVMISGTASAPRLELESEPPLPQRDILSLLATGTTTTEIGSNTGALASKAALLTVKRWWRRTFKKDDPEEDDAPSLLDRFELDVGSVDPRTGRPDVTGTLRVTDQIFFLGEIDMQGQTIGRVKYLIRFR